MRCCEQIKVNLGYMKQKVCMVGLASGLVLGNLFQENGCFTTLKLKDLPSSLWLIEKNQWFV